MNEKLIDLSQIPMPMRTDYATRNRNIESGNALCEECGGTGNYLLSMYQECPACKGTGAQPKKEPVST
jgi:DnaJ-class molecular chaperone